jgi:BirA family transcriptional regulator, biotin operon repressor / biotin---[acetyl-CoA-carboxylase] ligase
MHVALGSAHRDLRDARDLRIRKTEGIPEHNDRPLFRREPRQRLGDVVAKIGERRKARGIRLLVGGAVLHGERLGPPDSLEGDAVSTRVHDEPVQPGSELGLPSELAQPRAKLDEGLLRRVARLLEIAEELRRKPVHARRVACNEDIESAVVAVRGLANELGVAQALVEPGAATIPLVQTGLNIERLHGAISLIAVSTLDLLAPEAVEPLLAGRFGRPYLYEEACESTQRLLTADLDEGAVAVCDVQTAGRGRLGRAWEAPAGSSLLCSVLLEPPKERKPAELTLVAAVAVAETVEHALGLAVQIKWPNDVMVNRRKVAGILAEASGETALLGIGLNVNQTRDELPTDARVEPASLYLTDGVRRPRAPILADLLGELEHAYDRWRERGLGGLYSTIGARDFLRGRRVYLDGETGVGIGIDREGRFAIEIGGEQRLVESGELTYER